MFLYFLSDPCFFREINFTKIFVNYFYLGSKLDDCDDLEFSLDDNKSGGIRIFNSRFSCQFVVLPNVELSTKW